MAAIAFRMAGGLSSQSRRARSAPGIGPVNHRSQDRGKIFLIPASHSRAVFSDPPQMTAAVRGAFEDAGGSIQLVRGRFLGKRDEPPSLSIIASPFQRVWIIRYRPVAVIRTRLARILHELAELSADSTSAAWSIVRRVIAVAIAQGGSGKKAGIKPGCGFAAGEEAAWRCRRPCRAIRRQTGSGTVCVFYQP